MGAERREDQQARHLVFTYGTLKCGQPNHHILTNPKNGQATLVSTAKTFKKWPLVLVSSYEIPCLLPLEDVGYEVSGEVYLVDDRMLDTLDSLESHPDVYVRRQEDVLLLSSQPHSSNPVAEEKPLSGTAPSAEAGERLKTWIYFVRKVERKHLSLPFVPSYAQRVAYPTFTGEKEESLMFLDKEFRHVAADDSCRAEAHGRERRVADVFGQRV
uniref:Gamma-glutamylcyclotransferase family protein n=1 Tax=Rhipicephalus zambeziensis TaxID=60191 RepID=A0A224YDS3_9ACAR